MMNALCIDWGNTLVKAAVFNAEGKMTVLKEVSPDLAAATVQGLMDTHQPAAGILSAVAGDVAGVVEILGALPSFVHMHADTAVPIINAYHSPETLGTDRLAVAVAVQHEHPDKNNLVVSIGTCITYNFVARNRTFRGGAISPGMRMRLAAMHAFTHLLPEVKADGELLLLGYDTETCMRSGAVYGAGAEIHGMIQTYAAQYADFNPVLTGGDAAFFARQLKGAIFADPHLALRGLYLILKHNVPTLR